MKQPKSLEKKIQKLKKRLTKDAKKLAKLTLKLASAVAAGEAAAKKVMATTAAKRTPRKQAPRPGTKRKLNISPERRAQLSAAMKARWEAKRAAALKADQSDSKLSPPRGADPTHRA